MNPAAATVVDADLAPGEDREQELRARCRGIRPLTGRLEPWQIELLGEPGRLLAAVGAGEAPVNLIDPGPMERNGNELIEAASRTGVDLRIFFARKANKCLSLVDRAHRLGYGVDVASLAELEEAAGRGVAGADLVVTAAVKPEPLLRRSLALGATIVVDNADELRRLGSLPAPAGSSAPVAIRLAPELGDDLTPTRFGVPPSAVIELARDVDALPGLSLTGLHFHLDGYSADHRARALGQAIELYEALRPSHRQLGFIDIGGGIPMSYLSNPSEWEQFWEHHRSALVGDAEPLTFDAHRLGLEVRGAEVSGKPSVYPYWQRPVRGQWLAGLLGTEVEVAGSGAAPAARLLAERGIELRCEPGRSLLDGCGMTVAAVHFLKRRADGQALVGLGMNRTQCRSTSEDFMVDPILLACGAAPRSGSLDAYLVGAYCIERELISLRKLRFPEGVAVGDLVAFPNTAGYLMHILESSSHRMPLAANLIKGLGGLHPDPVDGL